ncbi:MAG: hypothetical protein ACI4VP_01850, partial [Clostridia bacterium]
FHSNKVAKRRGFIYFKSELFRGDRRGLLKALALLQRRWEATSNLKYKNPDEIWRSSFDIFNKAITHTNYNLIFFQSP